MKNFALVLLAIFSFMFSQAQVQVGDATLPTTMSI